jgi:GNAT superfamily N-acetyltransferase
MTFREAVLADIPEIQIVRNSVKENMLSDPALVSDSDCEEFISERGMGWVCELDGTIVGFSIADLREDNVWALFVHPDFDRKGIGRKLHDIMLDRYFEQGKNQIWLGTAPGTRAEEFYNKAGWRTAGRHSKEVKFKMDSSDWENAKSQHHEK